MNYKEYRLDEVTINLDKYRIPLSSQQRTLKKGKYPYYGAQGVIDYIDDFIFDGSYLLIAEDGENLKSKKNNIAQIACGKFWVNNHAHILLNNELSNLKYLCYLLNQINISAYITGSAQPKLSQSNLNQIIIRLPNLNEQKAIADTLSCLDDKIELNNRINKTLEEMVQAIFKSWFVDFEPFQDGEFVDSELGSIPKGWRVGTFSEIVSNTIGGDWGKDSRIGNYTEEVYCMRGADIPEINKGKRGKMPTRFVLPKNYAVKKLEQMDIVVEISGGSPTQSTGRVALVSNHLFKRFDKGMICTNFCRALKPIDGYAYFAYHNWQYLYDQNKMFSYENGTTGIKNFDISSFLNRESIIIPPRNLVLEYNSIIDSQLAAIFDNGSQSEKLEEIRNTLLPKLINGEIRVPVEE